MVELKTAGCLARPSVCVGWLLSLSLAIVTSFVSNNLHSRFDHRDESIDQQLATLERRAYVFDGKPIDLPEFRSRILFPLMLSGLIHIGGVRAGHAFLVLRFGCALVLFLSFWWVVGRLGVQSMRVRAMGAGVLSHVLILSFNQGGEVPSDYLDGLFTLWFVSYAIRGQKAGMFAATLIASLNRESATFAGIIWAAVHAGKGKQVEWVRAAALTGTSCGIVLALRYAFSVESTGERVQMIGGAYIGRKILAAINHPTPSVWPVLLVALGTPLAIWLVANRGWMGGLERRLIAGAAIITCVTLVFGLIDELRIFIPAAMILVVIAALTESHREAAGSVHSSRG